MVRKIGSRRNHSIPFNDGGGMTRRTKGWVKLYLGTPPRMDMHVLFPFSHKKNREIKKTAIRLQEDILKLLETKYNLNVPRKYELENAIKARK